MHNKTKLISSKFREFCPWLVAAITVLSANLTSNILWETFAVFTGRKDGSIAFWGVFLCLAFFMFMVKVLSRQKGFFRLAQDISQIKMLKGGNIFSCFFPLFLQK